MRADDKSDDAELIRQILDGDQSAFSMLCAKYETRLYAYIVKRVSNRQDAQEIVQDAFLRASEQLETLKEPEKVLNWMVSIAVQLIAARYRENRTHLGYASLNDVSELREEASLNAYRVSQQQAEEGELREKVSGAIEKLPDLDWSAMRLYLEGMSYREIAQGLGVTEAAVKDRLARAKRKVDD